MLTGIGIIIILKQIPYFFGYNSAPGGDFAFFQADGDTTFSVIVNAVNAISVGPTIIANIALVILLLWSTILSTKGKIFTLIQGPLVAVGVGIIYYIFTQE